MRRSVMTLRPLDTWNTSTLASGLARRATLKCSPLRRRLTLAVRNPAAAAQGTGVAVEAGLAAGVPPGGGVAVGREGGGGGPAAAQVTGVAVEAGLAAVLPLEVVVAVGR